MTLPPMARQRRADLLHKAAAGSTDEETLPGERLVTDGDEQYRKLSIDAAYCYISYVEDSGDRSGVQQAHRCFLDACETKFAESLLSSHECSVCIGLGRIVA